MKNISFNLKGMSSHDVAITSQFIAMFAKDDVDVMSKLGVTEALLTVWLENAQTLLNVVPHSHRRSTKALVTKDRNSSVAQLVQLIKELRSQLLFVYSPEDDKFNPALKTTLNSRNFSLVAEVAKLISNLIKQSEEDLTIYGITPERVTELEALTLEISNLEAEQKYKTKRLTDFTHERNELKGEVVRTLKIVSQIGKTYWLKRDKSKYDNYVIQKARAQASAQAIVPEAQDLAASQANANQFVS